MNATQQQWYLPSSSPPGWARPSSWGPVCKRTEHRRGMVRHAYTLPAYHRNFDDECIARYKPASCPAPLPPQQPGRANMQHDGCRIGHRVENTL
eukprot:8515-Pelagomonas_calceolata.AAC.2